MNKIILNKPLLFNKKYVVYFDSENKFTFQNKRAAADFIVKVEKKIEESILFITEEFNCLEEFYRLYYMADKDYKFKFTISNSIDFINNRLVWMLSHEGSPNHDVILFQAILNCIEELNTAFQVMLSKASQRKDTITKRRCALKVHIIEIYKERFMDIGIKPEQKFMRIKKQNNG